MADRTCRFAQLSDIHFARRFGGPKLALSAEQIEQRARELRGALERFADVVAEESLDICFIPGDIFESPTPSRTDIDFFIGIVNRLAPVPTIILPGNHDPYSRTSLYSTDSAVYAERPAASPRWGEHVRVITQPNFESLRIAGLHVAACGFQVDTTIEESPLRHLPAPDPDAINLLVFHGAQVPSERLAAGAPLPVPFTAEMLADAGYDYAAVGHYHIPRNIEDSDGRVIGAYAGSPLALDVTDTGDRGFLIGEIYKSAGDVRVELRMVRTDPRAVHDIEVDLTGHADAAALIESATSGVAPEDMLRLRLTGRRAGDDPVDVPDAFRQRFFQCVVLDESVPDDSFSFEGDAPTGQDAASRLTARMKAQWDAAGDDEKALIEEATAYALEALRRGEVPLR